VPVASAPDAPPVQEGAAGPYLRAILGHKWIVLGIAALTVGAAVAWLAVRETEYEATGEILVTPLPQDEPAFLGVQVLRDSAEPIRTIQTAASLAASARARELTAERLGRGWDEDRVDDAVEVEPIGESSVLAVTARDEDPETAARVAYIYTRAIIHARRELLRKQVRVAISQLQAQARRLDQDSGAGVETLRRLNQLELVRSGVDPTLSISRPAEVPDDPLGPPSWLVIVLAALAGLTLGAVTAVLVDALGGGGREPDEAEPEV
jgi:uncharacterized protein involved in exopolysaccharide biosynthesis